MLDFPLHEGFFPQIALGADELRYYKRLGKERVAQLIRVIEDADCAYKWTDVKATGGGHKSGILYGNGNAAATVCQKAQFLGFHPGNKETVASTLLKASVQISDVRVEEILNAVAKSKTKDFRKTSKYVHGASFVDGRTLFTFPSSSSGARVRPAYNYRAIKWHVMKSKQQQRKTAANDAKSLDFAYLEYAGKRKPPPGSHVVGFCVQESITREREIPTLESFGIARGYLSRAGIVVSRTHQANVLKVTAICQVDGDLNPVMRSVLEELMRESVCAVQRVRGLLERQRVSSLRFVEQWQWVPNADRKACAVCLRGFYFHRKHHCRTCGEVVCSSCAPLRELEEPIFDITQLRVCSVCMASASANFSTHHLSAAVNTSGNQDSSTSNGDTESYIRGLRSPQHNSYEDMMFQMRESKDRDRRGSDAAQMVLEGVAPLKERRPSVQPQPQAQQPLKYRDVKPQEKLQALTNVVSHIRDIRDTINISISEVDFDADEDAANGDGHLADDEIFNDVRTRMYKIRETLESSVHNFDAALANATHAPVYPRKHSARKAGPKNHNSEDSADDDGGSEGQHGVRGLTKSSDDSGNEDNVMTPEQFASVARITFAAARATKQAGEAFLSSCGSDVVRLSDVDDASVRTPDSFGTSYSDGSQDPYASSNYERVMASYKDEEEDNGKQPYYNSNQQSPPVPLRRKKSINVNPSSTRRASEIFQLERKIEELQRSLENAQRKLSVFEIEEPDPEQKGPLEVVYEESAQVEIESVFEVFGDRSDSSSNAAGDRGSVTVRPSLSNDKLVTTYDLVTELRGVMSSSEMTKPTGRRSFTKPPSPPLEHHHYHHQQQRQSLPSFGAGSIMPSPIPRRKGTSPSPTGSLDSHIKAKHADMMDNTASSSASGPQGHSFTSSNGVLVGSNVNADTSLESARYQHLMGSAQMLLGGDDYDDDDDDDDDSSDEQDDEDDQFVMMGTLEEPKLRLRPAEFVEPPFFAKSELEPPEMKRRPGGNGERRHTGGERRDESEELRKLMEGLSRPRSNSVPFGSSNQLGGAPTSDEQYEKPAWSDNVPNRAQNSYHIEQTLREVRSCLSSFLVECPSSRERERKLSSIFKVLRSLHREGVRSKFRTLNHDDIRYTKVLKETPSIIRLLKLAGYVSLPQKLTMRRVDQPYIGVILREIQTDLKH
ncbi:hypothetical protein Gpo141_00006672 [Globisporangium polare]